MEQSASMVTAASRHRREGAPRWGFGLLVVAVSVVIASCGQSVDRTAVHQSCGNLSNAVPGWNGTELSPRYAPDILAASEEAAASHDGALSNALHRLTGSLLLPVTGASESSVQSARSAAYAECARQGFAVSGG